MKDDATCGPWKGLSEAVQVVCLDPKCSEGVRSARREIRRCRRRCSERWLLGKPPHRTPATAAGQRAVEHVVSYPVN